ncbi:MAG: gamma-glutamylcyclotransferase family protein [Pseudomonadota bacterium]
MYGTLRRGGRNDIARYRPLPVFAGRAVIAGTLFDLGAYPGARLGGNGAIHGEVYAITSEVEAELDLLEEVKEDDSGEYVKRELRVVSDAGSWLCLIYEIQPDRVRDAAVIPGGDWLLRD